MPGIALALLAGAILILAALWLLQRRLIYLPFGVVPLASASLHGAEEVSLPTEDGLELGAWFVPGEEDATAVLVFNGNAGNRSLRAELAEALAIHGLSVLLFDYRGFGGNAGSPSESGLETDARAARDYLASRPEVDPTRIVYFGESLGAAVALELSTEHPPAALVLRSPFTSLTDVGRVHYPFLPVALLLRDRYPSIELIEEVEAPILVVAGERDRIVPPIQSRRLYEAASEPKRLVVIEGADHNDHALATGEPLVSETISFLRALGL